MSPHYPLIIPKSEPSHPVDHPLFREVFFYTFQPSTTIINSPNLCSNVFCQTLVFYPQITVVFLKLAQISGKSYFKRKGFWQIFDNFSIRKLNLDFVEKWSSVNLWVSALAL